MDADVETANAALAERLHVAYVHLVRRVERAGRSLPLGPSQLAILKMLVDDGGMAISHIVAAQGVRRATTTAVIARLEQAGYVIRVQEASDRRRGVVYATAAGRQAVLVRGRQRMSPLISALERATPAEIAAIQQASAAVEEALRGVDAAAQPQKHADARSE